MAQPDTVVERLGSRTRGSVLTATARIDEVASRPRQADRCASLSSRRRSARAPNARGDFWYYVDHEGRQRFNFRQRIWLSPSVKMAVTPVMTLALETLAINLLARMTRERDYPAAVGVTSRSVARLARRFCTECLLTAGPAGWVMPQSAIKAWLTSHRRIQDRTHRRTRNVRRRQGAGAR
jgi:hypothetical protein